MRVGPSESAFRRGLQTTPSCCGKESWWVSIGIKARGYTPRRYGSERRTKVNLPMTRRNPETCRQNQGQFDLLGQACRKPDYWAGGDRRKGGVKLIQALVWNCGNQSFRCKGRSTR